MADKTDAYGEVRMIANMESSNKTMNIALTENGVREFALSGQVAGGGKQGEYYAAGAGCRFGGATA